jgi:hypothetical protein
VRGGGTKWLVCFKKVSSLFFEELGLFKMSRPCFLCHLYNNSWLCQHFNCYFILLAECYATLRVFMKKFKFLFIFFGYRCSASNLKSTLLEGLSGGLFLTFEDSK